MDGGKCVVEHLIEDQWAQGGVADGGGHAADLPIAALCKRDLQPRGRHVAPVASAAKLIEIMTDIVVQLR